MKLWRYILPIVGLFATLVLFAQSTGVLPYCGANTSQTVIGETSMTVPPSNTPFRDPDFGSSMVRVTDANTLTSFGSQFTGANFVTDSSSEANEWGAFDPSIGNHGGYRFLVYTQTGWAAIMTLDATTMNVATVPNELYGSGGTFAYTSPTTLYFTNSNELESRNLTTNATTNIYNFASCPNMPSNPGSYAGGLTNSGDDTKFSFYWGGAAQGDTSIVTYYDTSTGNCYWYDSVTGMVGGTNMTATPVANGVGQLPTPPAPTVTATTSSGTLPAGNYYVQITAETMMNPSNGETLPSQTVGPITLSAPGSLVITFPTSLPDPSNLLVPGGQYGGNPNNGLSGLTPWNVYIGTCACSPLNRQNTSGPVGGTTYTQSTPLTTTSPTPPTVSTAGYNIHNARLTKDGTTVRVDAQQGSTSFYWQASTANVSACTVNCGGHLAMGYSHLVNDPNDVDFADVLLRPISNLSSYTHLVNPLPTPHQFTDSHWSWNDADPSDSMPVCGTFDRVGGTIQRAYDGEIVCVATGSTSTVWRFGHHRASAASFWATPRGNVSQDGKFYMWTSDWDNTLGRTDVFIVQLK